MKTLLKIASIDALAAVGVLVGINLLLASFVFDDLRYLAVPALAVFVPSFLYGMR